MVKVSVIIPAYNAEKYLRECLDSVVIQTLKDIEVIIINDGSVDNTLQIAQEHSSILPNFKIITTKNYGPGNARNIGLELATGEYIKFLDSDDELYNKDTLELMYHVASSNDIDVLIGKNYTHFGKINLSGSYDTLGRKKSGIIDLDTNKSYPFQEMPGIGDKLFKRSHIGDLRFPLKKWEDLAFTPVLMADSDRLYFLDEIVYSYRMSLNNTSIRGCLFANNIFDFFDVYDELNNNFVKRGIKEKYDNELLGLCSMHGHFDASFVPLWINMSLKDKKLILKYFITKLERYYPDFRNDDIANSYYADHKLFKKLFDVADILSSMSEVKIESLDSQIEEFIENSKIYTKK